MSLGVKYINPIRMPEHPDAMVDVMHHVPSIGRGDIARDDQIAYVVRDTNPNQRKIDEANARLTPPRRTSWRRARRSKR